MLINQAAEGLHCCLTARKVLGSIPSWGRGFLCGLWMFSPCLCGFFSGALVSSIIKTCTYPSLVSALDHDIVLKSGIGPWRCMLSNHCSSGIGYMQRTFHCFLSITVCENKDFFSLKFKNHGWETICEECNNVIGCIIALVVSIKLLLLGTATQNIYCGCKIGNFIYNICSGCGVLRPHVPLKVSVYSQFYEMNNGLYDGDTCV